MLRGGLVLFYTVVLWGFVMVLVILGVGLLTDEMFSALK
jgi:cytochrome c-type biogenesis protein CcmH/NrfF